MLSIRRWLLAATLLLAMPAFAHEDTPFRLERDGALTGFPEEFGPASLRVGFKASDASYDAPNVASVVLRIRDREVRLPSCLTGLLRSSDISQVRVAGSWYHEEMEGLPYYVNISFDDGPLPSTYWVSGYELLFDMRTARLLQMQVRIARDPRTVQLLPLDIAALCRGDTLPEPVQAGTPRP
ncbi:hypothetical protein LF41_2892 [Lysobacter dokdonensis DS-58]|uniref:Secreted protein n=1 Tax=Lysobacter dokdonensis DS-58 TaxID=1300345 RepID=A0A0A2WGD9_9GAMM|nr:hypothetical protein [Lysobacter dokdonensis]KGQ19246.1 hypothetical protein LF41_2892 [Lysobacter dokdonensis DS-58]